MLNERSHRTDHVLNNSIMKCPEQGALQRHKVDWWLLRAWRQGMEGGGAIVNGHESFLSQQGK